MSNLDRAYELFDRAARELRDTSAVSAAHLRARLTQVSEQVLDLLEDDEDDLDDPMARLDRQSRDIAEDLRRVDRLMRERGLRDP